MGDSLYRPDKRLIFSETFESEQAVRRNGGVPTNVTFSKGVATFNGTSSLIRYPNISRGTYSIRIVLSRLVIDTKYLYDFSERGNLGSGWCHILADSGVIQTVSTSSYVDGVYSNVVTSNTKEIVITGNAVICNLANWVIGSSYYNEYPINMDISLFEIYTGTLTADDVKNLYENKRYAVSDFNHTEQLGPELNTTFHNSTSYPYNTEYSFLNNTLIGKSDGSNYCGGCLSNGIPCVTGDIFKFTYTSAVITDSPTICFDNSSVGVGSAVSNQWIASSTTPVTIYFTLTSTGTFYFEIGKADIARPLDVTLTGVSLKKVLVNTTKEILNVSALNGVITNRYSGEAYIELCTNAGTGDQTDWVDSNADGLADYWSCIAEGSYPYIKTIVSGNGFIGNAQRVQENNDINYATLLPYSSVTILKIGSQYRITGKYRSSAPLSVHKASGPQYSPGQGNLGPANTGNAAAFDFTFTAVEVYWYIATIGTDAWLELDEVSIKEVIPSPVSTDIQVVKENDIYAMKFNGTTSIVNCGSYDTLLGDKSFKMWFKGSNVASLYYSGLFSNTRFLVNFEDSKANLFFMRDGGIDGSWTYTTAPYNTYFRNKWVCLAGTWTSPGDIVKLYYNGVGLSMGRAPSTSPMAGTDIIIGFARQAYMTGMVGSLSIYDGILTAQEIAQMYSSEKNKYGL